MNQSSKDDLLSLIDNRRFALVIDQNLLKDYAIWIKSLESSKNWVGTSKIYAVEAKKTIGELSVLLEELLSFELHRDDLIVAVGGGIVTDMAGLAAHLIKRGTGWIAVPTTLLGMIDAAIGGKTAVDTPQGKNLIGAFHPPLEVIVLPEFLKTLPEREWVNGLGEAVKYGFLERPDILEKLYAGHDYKELVLANLMAFKEIKERIVHEDPTEMHVRMHLNFGHTLGHCLEKHFDYQRFAHGEAVMYGIYWALVMSNAYSGLSGQAIVDYLHWLTRQTWYDLEVLQHPEWFISGLGQDKKIRAGKVNFVLLEALGKPVIRSFNKEDLLRMLTTANRTDTSATNKEILPDKTLMIPHPICGDLQAPPSKSDSHRAIIAGGLAALTSDSVGSVDGLVFSKDVAATLKAMAAFGLNYRQTSEAIVFESSDIITPSVAIDCVESGSTLRFCIPMSQLVKGAVTFTGQNHLRHRPLTDYERLFHDKDIDYTYSGTLPMTISQGSITGNMELNGNVSSQYFSGLFFTLPLLNGDSEIQVVGELESKGYVDMTIDTLSRHGITIQNNNYKGFSIRGSQKYQSCHYRVEGDYSNAAFWIVAGQISGPVKINGLKPESLQRDKEVIDVVRAMGGQVTWEGNCLISTPSKTRGIVIDAREIPDIIPILCVLAALSEGETTVINGQRLRVKESDRIKSTVSELKKLGAIIEETEDGMRITGKNGLDGGNVESWNDHRIAMAMAIAASRCLGPVLLSGASAVTKSYPHFFSDYNLLGGKAIFLESSKEL